MRPRPPRGRPPARCRVSVTSVPRRAGVRLARLGPSRSAIGGHRSTEEEHLDRRAAWKHLDYSRRARLYFGARLPDPRAGDPLDLVPGGGYEAIADSHASAAAGRE